MSVNILHFDELGLKQWHDIIKLRVDVFVVEQECPYPEVDGLDPHCLHLWCPQESTGQLMATLRIIPPEHHKGTLGLGRVVVSQEFRGTGLGVLIMKEAMSFMDEHHPGIKQELHAQDYLEHFYQKLGFKTVGEAYDWDGIVHVPMERIPISSDS